MKEDRLREYLDYHEAMMISGDMDPAYPALRYLSDRFELNMEQRYWLAFLYATCYCAPTVYFIYSEFPDFENVDFSRMERWWVANRHRLLFQTDRRWIRSRNQFVPMVRSYYDCIGPLTQAQKFLSLATPDRKLTYDQCFVELGKVYQMGRFALFIYLEAVHVLTGFAMEPTGLDLKNAESSRNGLCFAIGRDDLIRHYDKRPLAAQDQLLLASEFQRVYDLVAARRPYDTTVWNVETSLCAFKKHKLGKRWIGYYIERMRKEIEYQESAVTDGVDWSVLWDFRREHFAHQYLTELN